MCFDGTYKLSEARVVNDDIAAGRYKHRRLQENRLPEPFGTQSSVLVAEQIQAVPSDVADGLNDVSDNHHERR